MEGDSIQPVVVGVSFKGQTSKPIDGKERSIRRRAIRITAASLDVRCPVTQVLNDSIAWTCVVGGKVPK